MNTTRKRISFCIVLLVLFQLGLPASQARDGSAKIDSRASRRALEHGLALENAGSLVDAYKAYGEAVSFDPTDADCRKHRGWLGLRLGRLEQSLDDFEFAARAASDDSAAAAGMGAVLAALHRPQEALPTLNRAIELGEDTPVVRIARAGVFVQLGDSRRALRDYGEAIRLRLDNPEPYFLRGKLFSSLGRYNDAIEDFTRCLRWKPEYAEAYVERGTARGEIGLLEDGALPDFDQALLLDPEQFSRVRDAGGHLRPFGNIPESNRRLYQGHRPRPVKCEALPGSGGLVCQSAGISKISERS